VASFEVYAYRVFFSETNLVKALLLLKRGTEKSPASCLVYGWSGLD